MDGAEEGGFKLRWRQVNPGVEHLSKEVAEGSYVGFCRTFPVSNGFGIEEPGKHGSGPLCRKFNPGIFRCRHYAVHQFCGEAVEPRINFAFFLPQYRKST